jgi:hypothetical protein
MRLAVVIASVLSVSGLLLLAACSDQTSDTGSGTPVDDAGAPAKKPSTSSSSGDPTQDDGGSTSSSGGPMPVGTSLVNEPVILWGVTDDGMVVYQPLPATQGAPTSLEAIPLVGGAKTTIAASVADTDVISVSGGAVAWWTSVTGGLGTFNVWTKANGAKTAVATTSLPDFFAASPDGARIAFSVSGAVDLTDPNNPAPTSTNLSVTSSSSPTATALKLGATTMTVDLASQTCAPDTAFAGSVFLSGHCSAGSATPHLYAVGPTDTAATRLDGTTSTTTVKAMADGTYWSADTTGAKVFAIVGTTRTGRIFDSTGSTLASLDTATAEGNMLGNGSAVVYRTTTLMRGTAVASPVKTTLLAAATTPKGILSISADDNRILFNTLDPPASGAPLIDVRLIDTTSAAQAPTDIVATGTAYPLGFTADSAHVLYYTDITATGITLKTRTPAGGAETTLATGIAGARRAQSGAGVLLLTNPQKDANGLTSYDLQAVSAATGGAPTPIAAGVPDGLYDISGSKLVYVSFDKTNPGLYVTNLP